MKDFLDVFPGLHMTEQMQELLSLVGVERVSMPRDRSSLRIYLNSPRLIHKKNIWDLERGIREQLFPGKQIQIRIFERFCLSEQYTPEKLLKVYRDSLLMELKNYSIIEYSIFRKAECTFPRPDLLHMTVENTMVNREKAGELKRVLEKVVHERCGLPVEIEYEYVEPVRARGTLERELQAKHQAEELAARYLEHHSTEEENSQEAKSGASASAEKGKTKASGKGSENGGSITRGETRPGDLLNGKK